MIGKERSNSTERNRTDGHAPPLRYNAFAPEGDKNKDRVYKHENLVCITLQESGKKKWIDRMPDGSTLGWKTVVYKIHQGHLTHNKDVKEVENALKEALYSPYLKVISTKDPKILGHDRAGGKLARAGPMEVKCEEPVGFLADREAWPVQGNEDIEVLPRSKTGVKGRGLTTDLDDINRVYWPWGADAKKPRAAIEVVIPRYLEGTSESGDRVPWEVLFNGMIAPDDRAEAYTLKNWLPRLIQLVREEVREGEVDADEVAAFDAINVKFNHKMQIVTEGDYEWDLLTVVAGASGLLKMDNAVIAPHAIRNGVRYAQVVQADTEDIERLKAQLTDRCGSCHRKLTGQPIQITMEKMTQVSHIQKMTVGQEGGVVH